MELRNDAHAQRFAGEMRQRYGEGVVAELAAGRAVVAAAKAHVALELTLWEVREAEAGLATACESHPEREWER